MQAFGNVNISSSSIPGCAFLLEDEEAKVGIPLQNFPCQGRGGRWEGDQNFPTKRQDH